MSNKIPLLQRAAGRVQWTVFFLPTLSRLSVPRSWSGGRQVTPWLLSSFPSFPFPLPLFSLIQGLAS